MPDIKRGSDGPDVHGCEGCDDAACGFHPPRPIHGDVWERHGSKFSVMHICGHHDPPCVTGYWWRDGSLDACLHGSIPLPRFVKAFTLVERGRHDRG